MLRNFWLKSFLQCYVTFYTTLEIVLLGRQESSEFHEERRTGGHAHMFNVFFQYLE